MIRTFALLVLAGGAGLGATAWPALRWAQPAPARAIIAAAAICLVAALLALVPVIVVTGRRPDCLIQAGLGAMVIRLVLSLVGGAAYFKHFAPPTRPFMIAAVVAYLVLLAVDTVVTLRLVGGQSPRPSRPDRDH